MQAAKRLFSCRASSLRACRLHKSAVGAQLSIRTTQPLCKQSCTRTPQLRQFSLSSPCQKKGGKAAREASRESTSSSSSSTNTPAASSGSEDPSDFSALEEEIAKVIDRLRSDLSKLRSGGRFNPDVLEALRVQLGKGSDSAVVKLGDVAQVIPKGRTVQVLVGEQDYMKPVASAIQSSNLSLTPQPDPTGQNPLLLIINIPPPTAESRKAAVAAAGKAGDTANNGIRSARQAQQKKLRAMQLAKSARPDDLKKAGTAMEKVVEKGVGEIKKVVDNAKKVLDA